MIVARVFIFFGTLESDCDLVPAVQTYVNVSRIHILLSESYSDIKK